MLLKPRSGCGTVVQLEGNQVAWIKRGVCVYQPALDTNTKRKVFFAAQLYH